MSGEKIDQAREAAKFVVNNLKNDDLFNVVVYDDHVESFRPELQRFSDDSRSTALGFINGINAGGSTNIDEALNVALKQMHRGADAPYIVFLTDGLPTAGETNEMKIVDHVKQWNRDSVRIVCFGVGYDVNSRLLDRLSRANHGQSEYVRPDQNIEEAVSRLYRKISSPVLTGMTVDYRIDGVTVADGEPVNRVYPAGPIDLFRGEQVVLVGRYRKPGHGKIVLRGKVDKQDQTFEFDVNFAGKNESLQNRFAEKLWAARRIGEIIDLLDLNGQNQELIEELVHLSQRHGILTPYTAYLADENQDVRRLSSFELNAGESKKSSADLGITGGAGGFNQRLSKGNFKSAGNLAQSQSAAAPALQQARGFGGRGDQPAADDASEAVRPPGMRYQNGQSLYKRGRTVVAANASDIDLEKAKDSIINIKRFSDPYFELVKDNSVSENEILSAQADDEELIVRLRGKIYRIQ